MGREDINVSKLLGLQVQRNTCEIQAARSVDLMH